MGNFFQNIRDGISFTWRGTRNGQLVEERLDRGPSNKLWQDCWPNTLVIHETVIGSDHCPLIIQCQPRVKRSKKLFHFEAFWAKEERCKEIMERCWRQQCVGDGISRWQKKLNDCRSQLASWSRQKFKSRGRDLECLIYKLGDLQHNWSKNWEEIKTLSLRIDKLWEIE